jgi:hypothetical protein
MDQLIRCRQIIRAVLTPYSDINYANVKVENFAAFAAETEQYIILSEG